MSGFDLDFNLISRALDVAALRHKVIANNLANANTPGYRRLVVDFKRELTRALDGAEAAKLTVVEADDPAGPDGNNVSFDRELADLQKNSLIFSTFAQVADTRLKALRSAIDGRL
jgi:flagellar basal-body rod protein FlgB